MIARVDDISHSQLKNLNNSREFPFYLTMRLPWSKNIKEERDAPDQILVGANDPKYCVLLALGIHLETYISKYDPDEQFLFGMPITCKGGKDKVLY